MPPAAQAAGSDALADVALNNDYFKSTLGAFADAIPSDPANFYQAGVRIIKQRIPKSCRVLYRETLHMIASLLLEDPASEATWKLFLLFDGLVLAPVTAPDTAHSAIKRRLAWLRAGDWTPLIAGLKYRVARNTVGG